MEAKSVILQNKFLRAIQNNDTAAVESLLDQGVDIDTILESGQHHESAICICVRRGYYKMAKMLVTRGCNLNITSAAGSTPLNLAGAYQNNRLVKLFLKNGAIVNVLDRGGHTALYNACRKCS